MTLVAGANETWPGLMYDAGGWAINAKHPNYGAKVDGKLVIDGATIAASVVFTSASAAFTSADVGKIIRIDHAALTVATGTVTAAAGVATFSVSQAQFITNGSKITVGGVAYTVSAFNGTTGCTLSGAPTFGASAFSVSSTLLTTIASYTNATTVNLTVAASVALTAATTLYATDDAAAIQAATDAAIASGAGEVVVPAGIAISSTTLHAGYGNVTYQSVIIRGAGYKYRGSAQFNGTAIFFTQSDRPGINFQGARGSRLKNIAIIGPLFRHIQAQQMGGASVSITDDTVAANWQDGALAATQESRYSPLAGVTVDAYAGAQPATHYPAVSYPGGGAQYNKLNSSDVVLDSVYIAGFNTAFANQPADTDANGDFTTFRDCYIEMCKYAVSVGNTQSRGVTFEGTTKISSVYAAFANNVHGRQTGKFGSVISNVQVFGCIHLLQFGIFYWGPITFDNLYAESLWRLGTVNTGSTNEPALIFLNCECNLTAQTDARGHPATVLDGGAGYAVDVKFIGGSISGYKSVVGMDQLGLSFEGTFFRHDGGTAARANPYQYFAHNALCGGLVTRQLNTPDVCWLKSRPYNIDTGVALFTEFTRRARLTTRINCIPFYAEYAAAQNEPWDKIEVPRLGGNSIAKSSLTTCTLSGSTLTMQFSARSDALFLQNGPNPGDIIWDDQTFSTFFVRSRTTTTILAELQNNYKVVAGVVTPLAAISTSVGNFYWRNARLYTPQFYLRGDCTAATAGLTNCARDDGFAAWYDTEISVGDAIAVFDRIDNWNTQTTSDITARSQAAGTITLSGGAGMRAQIRRRFAHFIRQAPTNV